MTELLINNLPIILSGILTLLSLVFGKKFITAKNKGKELADLLNSVLDAVEDNKITPEEEKVIAANIRKLISKK